MLITIYFITTNEIPGDLPRENMKLSHVKDPPSLYIYLINRAFRSQKKLIAGKLKIH